MGQKINPIGLRLQVNRTWDSRWFADGQEYGKLLHEDLAIREKIRKSVGQAGISRIIIERPHRKARVTIHAARPGVIIGKKGADIETLRKKLAALTKSELHLNIVEVRKPEIDAQLVAENIAQQLERRVSFRRAMKRAVQNAMRMGALGIRVNVGGRLGGAEIARTEWYREGRVPLHTLRADVDYAHRRGEDGLRRSSGSRSGSSRARSWSTIRRPATGARPSCRKAAPGGCSARAEGVESDAATEEDQVPQDAQGAHQRAGEGGLRPQLRLLRAEGARSPSGSPRARSRRRGVRSPAT
jgi:small subunit ribosomal protein S3